MFDWVVNIQKLFLERDKILPEVYFRINNKMNEFLEVPLFIHYAFANYVAVSVLYILPMVNL